MGWLPPLSSIVSRIWVTKEAPLRTGQEAKRAVGLFITMRESTQRPYLFFGGLSGAIACLTTYLVWMQTEVSLALSALVGLNIAAVVAMGLDKSFARSGSLRIPEAVLFIIAFLGGSPGILAGVHLFKHKNRKAAFQLTLLIVFALQVGFIRMLGIGVR